MNSSVKKVAMVLGLATLSVSSLAPRHAVAQDRAAPGAVESEAADSGAATGGPRLGRVLQTIWSVTHLSTKWYLGYTVGEAEDSRFNRFFISRGYLTIKLKPLPWFEPRVTLDCHQNDDGDFVVRIKYLHAKFKVPVETAVISEPYIEFGVAHTPWFDFEEQINRYRMEGAMFLERNELMNSADLGGTVGVLLGRKLPETYQKKVSKTYPGTWGSVALGVYNGGGYHAAEQNDNKVFQSRVSLRPIGPWLPNLQLSHFFVYGKGNTADEPAWMINAVMASFEHQVFVLTAQVARGEGNQKGDKVDSTTGAALDFFGASFFGELKLPWIRSALMARVDRFDWGTDGGPPATTRLIVGHAFCVTPKNILLLSLDRATHDGGTQPADWQVKLTLQAAFPI